MTTPIRTAPIPCPVQVYFEDALPPQVLRGTAVSIDDYGRIRVDFHNPVLTRQFTIPEFRRLYEESLKFSEF